MPLNAFSNREGYTVEIISGDVISGGALINFQCIGAGEPIILLHDFAGDSSMWKDIANILSSSFKVITVDLRGHGKSGFGMNPLSIFDMSEDILKVMESLELNKAAIAGFKGGGLVALNLGVSHPERVSSLIISDIYANASGLRTKPLFKMYLKQLISTIGTVFSRRAVREKQTLDLMLSQLSLRGLDLAGIKASVLITVSEETPIRQSHIRYMSECIDDAHVKVIPGRDRPPGDYPEDYSTIITEFLRRYNT